MVDEKETLKVKEEDVYVTDSNEFHKEKKLKKHPIRNSILLTLILIESFSGLAIILFYILMGVLYKDPIGSKQVSCWAGLWPVFLLLPVPESFRQAVQYRKISLFAMPLLITSIYCFVGMLTGLWHPTWVIFFAIPIFYGITAKLDSIRE